MSINIYQMYYNNGKKFGFFVQRNSWSNTAVKIIGFEGVEEGDDLIGEAPYYNSPKVYGVFYDKTKRVETNRGEVSCPGTYAYKRLVKKKKF